MPSMNPTTSYDACYCELSHRAVIRVHGEKASQFLQGQLTCDVSLINPQHSSIALHCNAQGRVISDFRVIQLNGSYYLITHCEMLDIALKNLNKYAIFSGIELIDESAEWQHIGVFGASASTELKPLLTTIPTQSDDCHTEENIVAIRVTDTLPRWHILGNPEAIQQLKQKISSSVGQATWDTRNIEDGLVQIAPPTSEKFTPHVLNFQHGSAISFAKGCYTGQEIIARMHYRGKLKQQLYRAHIEAEVIPQLGSSIYVKDHNNPVGHIVAATPNPTHGFSLLITLQNQCADSDDVHYSGIALHDISACSSKPKFRS